MTTEFSDWSQHWLTHTEQALAHYLPPAECVPHTLHAAMRYSVLGGGKRIRPLLTYAAGEIARSPVERVTAAACAVELIHAYSLIHDDLPAMDNDAMRRGKPTCHVAFDEATALLAGDSLQSLAFELLSDPIRHEIPMQQIEMIRLLARASGSRGMAGGQAIDLEHVGREIDLATLETMHRHKTGALIEAAVLLGALCGDTLDAGQFAGLKHYAHDVGLAFQVIDDVLDATVSSDRLGKTAGKDAAQQKPTYVSLMGCDAARAFATRLHEQAVNALHTVPRHQRLIDLADRIVQRTS